MAAFSMLCQNIMMLSFNVSGAQKHETRLDPDLSLRCDLHFPMLLHILKFEREVLDDMYGIGSSPDIGVHQALGE